MARWTALAGVLFWARMGLGTGSDRPATSAPALRHQRPAPAAAPPGVPADRGRPARRRQPAPLGHVDDPCPLGRSRPRGPLVALAAYAQKLVPGDLETAWVLSSIYDSRREAAAAEEVMLLRLRGRARATSPWAWTTSASAWLPGPSPSDRQAFLQSIMDNSAWPDALRAQAAVEQGRAFLADRLSSQALQLFTRALQLDKLNTDALQGIPGAGASPAGHRRTRSGT